MAVARSKAKAKPAAEPQPPDAPTEETVTSIKGFDQNLRCRDFQFAIGGTYECGGEIIACQNGFHAVDYPLDVFGYYPPATSRYALVIQSGALARHSGDTKIASAKITVEAEIRLPDLIDRAIRWVFDRAKPEGEGSHATGYQGAASSTGTQGAASSTGTRGAASSTGTRGAASSTGDQGAASSTGTRGAASSTGYQGAASSTGYQGAASSTGDQGAGMACGRSGRVMGADGNALFLVYRNYGGEIEHAWAGIAGRDGIAPLTWYTLDEHGKPQEAA